MRGANVEVGLASLLPAVVEVEETVQDAPLDVLLPAEREAVAAAVPSRRAEFATVRDCARRALRRLGYPDAPILPGAARAPQWPEGIVGSMTHCEGYRAAAIARASDVLTLGIDAEVHEPLPAGVAELVMVGEEPTRLAALAASRPEVAWDRVLFSAKESVYKAWFPLERSWLDFTECEVEIDPREGGFTGRLLVPGPVVEGRAIQCLSGRWIVCGRRVLTAVWESHA